MRKCASEYSGRLDTVRTGLGDSLRAHPLEAAARSDRELIIGAGSGTTGTHSVQRALRDLGLFVVHWKSHSPTYQNWTLPVVSMLEGNLTGSHGERCMDRLRSFDYTTLPPYVEGITDTPAFENFLNLFLAFPRARVILTTRDPAAWATTRVRKDRGTCAPMQEPCGWRTGDFSHQELASLYSYNNDFIRCIVPRRQLIELDLFSGGAPGGHGPTLSSFVDFLGLSPRQAGYFRLQHHPVHSERFTPVSFAGRSSVVGRASPKVHVFVAYGEERADRRACLGPQLEKSPYLVKSVQGVEAKDVKDVCPGMEMARGELDAPAVSSSPCTNFLIWQYGFYHYDPSDCDFIVVLEGDAMLAPHAWDELEKLLAGPCQDFDIIQVDTSSAKPEGAGGGVCPDTDLALYQHAGVDARMQIVRVSALPRILGYAAGAPLLPARAAFSGNAHGIRSRSWQPGLVQPCVVTAAAAAGGVEG